MRTLLIELRRSAALWTGGLTLVLALVLLYGFPGPWAKGAEDWTEEWTNLARWLRYHLMLLWPVALAAGAWQGRRDHRSKMDELLATVPRPAVLRVLPPVLAMCIGLVGAYLVLFLVGAVQVIGNTSFNDFGWVPILLVGFLSLIAGALVGMGIGRVLPFVLTAPVLGVAGLVAMVVTSIGSPGTGSNIAGSVSQQVALLGPALENARNAFDTIATMVSVLQMVWFVALGLTGFALFALSGFSGRQARLLAPLPVIVGAAIVLPLLPSRPDQVVIRDTEAVALVCAPGAPRVCVSRLHEDQLDELATPAREVLAALARLPAPQPTSVVESMRSRNISGPPGDLSPDVIYAQLDDFEFTADSRRTMLAGPEQNCPESDYAADMARRAVIASWFDGELAGVRKSRPMPPDVAARAESLWQSLRSLPADQQAARVAGLRAQAYRC
ncbi:hypothetical protein JOF56_005039 [Kibdelosporangium banguiense]|uniref:ABC-type transport system involved in multi-copper enzyme maturation, permease component n=1 Tax=Kibdelosporangium banguiense TaxID=1365924 RepID=A0ABS4TKX9_9PSEU|nr:hypothetical protein [Kibdelosporangium banguiense]MBP2324654.1 hypothetical protein [Kibdelosporangium banguiense]